MCNSSTQKIYQRSVILNTQELINTFSSTRMTSAPKKDFVLSTADYGVHILSDSIYNFRYKGNTRAICKERTGHIYIKESSFSNYVLIHELIHRLSRNQKTSFLGRKYWQNGIATIENGINYTGLNEIITEWFATKISGWELGEGNPNLYQSYFPLFQSVLTEKEDSIAEAYFQGDAGKIYTILQEYNITGLSYDTTKEFLNELSERIIHREPCLG